MSKTILAIVLVVFAAIALVLYLNRPEPTPAERLEDAVEDAGGALRDAGEAISEGIQNAQAEITQELQSASAEFADMAADSAEKMTTEAAKLVEAWKETGIVTQDGFNFEIALKAVEESSLDEATKDKVIAILQEIRDAPETMEKQLREIRAVLEGVE